MKKLVCLAGVLSAMTPALATASDMTSMQINTDSGKKVIIPMQRPTEAKRYIVQFKPDNNTALRASSDALFNRGKFAADNAARMVEGIGGNIKRKLPSVKGLAAELTPAQVMQLKKDSRVAFVEEDPERSLQANGTSYGINMIQANQVSDGAISNQKVCIIDTGYDINHEDLMNGANVTGEVSNTLTRDIDIGEWTNDSYGHGTHVAGTLSALNNSVGVEGVSPNGLLNLHIVKVIHKSTWWRWYGSDVIDAISKCQTAGATVINMSLAGTKNSVAEQQAIDNAYNNGTLLVGASGNAGSTGYFYPASYDSVISVGAVDQSSNAWMYTQQNDQIELAAPGVGVNSTLPGNTYGLWDGTSMATPYVSGAAALVWSHFPQCSNQQIRNVLQLSAQDLGASGRDDTYGHGLVQAKAAMDLITNNGCSGIPAAPAGLTLCKNQSGTSGVYGSGASQVHCNMDVDGGGWTLVDTRTNYKKAEHAETNSLTDPATQANHYINKDLWQPVKAASTEIMITDGDPNNFVIFEFSQLDTASCATLVDDLSKTPVFHAEKSACSFTGSDYTYLSNPNMTQFFTTVTMYNTNFYPKLRSGKYGTAGQTYYAPEKIRIYVR